MSAPRFVAIPLGQSQRFRGVCRLHRDPLMEHSYVCPHAHRKAESAIACAREWFLREGK